MNDYVVGSTKVNRRGTAIRIFWVLLLAVIVAVAAASGMYVWQQHGVDSRNKQIATLQTQVSSLQAKLKSAQQPPAAQPVPAAASYSYVSPKGVQVKLYAPTKNATVASPVAVVGEVPGNWSFEAQFPVLLKDAAGSVVAQGTAQVLGDWMTDQLVPFSAKLTYTAKPSGSGTLVLQKDNPSGLAQNDDAVAIPVQF